MLTLPLPKFETTLHVICDLLRAMGEAVKCLKIADGWVITRERIVHLHSSRQAALELFITIKKPWPLSDITGRYTRDLKDLLVDTRESIEGVVEKCNATGKSSEDLKFVTLRDRPGGRLGREVR
jgi:hypothetical protein